MKFTVTHARAFIGSNITVQVEADEKEGLRSIAVELDGDALATGDIAAGTEQFTQEYTAVGEAGAGVEHTLTITATDGEGRPHLSTTRWVDTI